MGGALFRFEKLEVWQKAMAWVGRVYRASAGFPAEERFGLTSQVRRAAVSVPSNIAEGAGRLSGAELARFVEIAYGSLMEVVCQCRLASDLGYLSEDEHSAIRGEAEELARMLSGLRTSRESRAES